MAIDKQLGAIYSNRFSSADLLKRNSIWKTLCRSFFQRYISAEDAVLDLGAGYCEFINNISCANKIAVDLNSDILNHAGKDVEVYVSPAADLSFLPDKSVNVAFMSNFLEHLRSKDDVLKTISEIFRVLKPGGKILVLMPNIKYACREYWDYFDHNIPLSDKSLVEALQISGFEIDQVIPRFLPYSTQSKIPQYSLLIKLYLKLPLIWKIMGKQMFVSGKKPCTK